jgi:hypothetical protein
MTTHELVIKLRSKKEELEAENKALEARSLALECRVKELEGALKIYANESNWLLNEFSNTNKYTGFNYRDCHGDEIAKKALSTPSPEPSKLMAVVEAATENYEPAFKGKKIPGESVFAMREWILAICDAVEALQGSEG